MRGFNLVFQFMIAATAVATLQGCGGDGPQASQLHRAVGETGTGGTKGGKCKVVSGSNSGKTGTYDGEGWCSGDWGATECVGSDGKSNGKCQDVKKVVITRPIETPIVVGLQN